MAHPVQSPPLSPVAVVTGASQGLGRALARALAERRWRLVIDARRTDRLDAAATELAALTTVTAIAGDVRDPAHRSALLAAAAAIGPLRLLVNNASSLGASPLPPLGELTDDAAREAVDVNLLAPLALIRDAVPALRTNGGTVLNVSSDAAVEAYEGWGPYGATKAALDHASRVLAVEEPGIRVLAVDPGDMRTELHQLAFPGEDISDRPPPDDAVRGIVALLDGNEPSGRYRAGEVAEVAEETGAPAVSAEVGAR